jgi:tetratricopeptide (TPR) repeat protein
MRYHHLHMPGFAASRRAPAADAGDAAGGASVDTFDTAESASGPLPLEELAPPPAVPDVDRERVRAKLKAELFQIHTEPVRIGRFPILGRLGQGGMGTVFSAFDAELDRKIAVKVMLPDHAAEGSQGRERTRREAQAMARLSHPNIVAVHEVGEADQQVFIAMEFVRGVSLDVWLAQRSRTTREVLHVFRQAGRGLAAAHDAGLVHRDFKPSNVMVGDDGQIKILDFGLARATDDVLASSDDGAVVPGKLGDGSLTRPGTIMGTPAFMAPEQHRGKPATALSDQFSFCVALYTALYGAHPFGATALPAMIAAVCDGSVAPPPKQSAVPAWLRRVVVRGLSRAPEDRFASMAALLDALAADPGARRRRWLFRGAGAIAVLGAGFGIARLAAHESCPDGRQALQGAWDDARRDRVAEALRGGAAHGAETWMRVEATLDGYAAAWATAREDACRAMRSGAASDLLYERRVACLSRSRSALDALVEVFEHADATVVERAVAAAAGLPALARCDDTEGLLAEVEPPSESIAAEVAGLRDRLARARSMEDAGRVVEGIGAANDVLAQAERLAYPPLVAEALLRRGSGELLMGDAGAAADDLGRATWVALEAGDDAVAAEAASRRIFVRSELIGRPADAQIELPWARALADATHDDALRGLFLHNAAAVMSRAGDPEQARELAEQALAARLRLWSPEHPEIALTLANLGHFERDLGDYTAAIATLREAVRVTEVALGPLHPQRAMIGTVIGTTLLEQGDYAAAGRELASADAIYVEGLGAQAMPRYFVMVAMGDLARRERRWADARRALESALALAQPQVEPNHPMLADARLALAEVVLAAGGSDRGEAEAMGRAAVDKLEAGLGATHPYVASAWLRLGRLLLDADAPERAEPLLRRALESTRAQPSVSAVDVAWYELWLARSRLAAEPAAAASEMQACLDALVGALPGGSPRLAEATDVVAHAWLAAADRPRALALLERERVELAALRRSDDPDLAWLDAQRAHLQAALSSDPAGRARATQELGRAAEVLAAHPGFARELGEAREWLEPAADTRLGASAGQ